MSTASERTEQAKQDSKRRTRRSFLVAGVGAAAGFGLYHWLDVSPVDDDLTRPLRKTMKFNAALSRGVFDERGLTPTYDVSKGTNLRINGTAGLEQKLDLNSYRLQVVGVEGAERMPQYVKDVTAWQYKYLGDLDAPDEPEVKTAPAPAPAYAAGGGSPAPAAGAGAATGKTPADGVSPQFAAQVAAAAEQNSDGRPDRGEDEAGESDSTLDPGTPGLLLTMADLEKLPRHELVTQFKCIEGWSQIVQWDGFPMREFIKAYPPAKNAQGELPKYVYMETPDGNFYCGYTMDACMHPQSTLVTAMMGKSLEQLHGAPLRLHMPIKYGYKQLKRISLIAYMDEQPDDYWTKLGYDWYAGL